MRLSYIFPKHFKPKVANRIQTVNQAFYFDKILGKAFSFLVCDGYTDACLDCLGLHGFSSMVQLGCPRVGIPKSYLFWLKLFLSKKYIQDSLLYIRDYDSLILLTFLKKVGVISNKIIFEAHDLPNKSRVLDGLRLTSAIIAISGSLQDELQERIQYDKLMLVAHDGFSPLLSDQRKLPLEVERVCSNLSKDSIVYVGTYHKWKNIELIIEVANLDSSLSFVIVGVKPEDLSVKPIHSNVTFLPFLDHALMSSLLKRFRYAIVTTSNNYTISKYTSPLKLFEYLASGLTVFVPDVRNMREVVGHRSTGYLYDNQSVIKAASLIKGVVEHCGPIDKAKIVAYAQQFSWESRAIKIVSALSKLD